MKVILSEAKFKRNTSSEYSQAYDPLKRPIYDWKRKKKLSPSHPKYTMAWLKANARHFDSLSFLHIVLLTLFWTKRNICHSFKEIAEDCGLFNRHVAYLLMKLLESLGYLTIKHQNWKGKYCGRNWYKLTYKGQKLLKLILNKAFRGTPIPSEALPIKWEKNYPREAGKSRGRPRKNPSKKDSTEKIVKHITKSSLRSDIKKNMHKESADSSSLSFEKKEKISRECVVWNPALFDSGASDAKNVAKSALDTIATLHQGLHTPEYRRRKALIAEYDFFKNCERRKLFQKLGAGKFYDEKMHIGIWRALEKEPLEKISKALKIMRKKVLKKGSQVRNLVGFFTHLMKDPEAMGYSNHKAKNFRDALDGKETPGTDMLLRGEVCAEFVSLAKEMEEKTGEKVDRKTLAWMTSKGSTHVWLKALQAVKFRRQLDDPNRPKPKNDSEVEKRMPILPGSVVMEDVYEDVTMKKTVTEEVAVRDEDGRLKRDENGKIVWEQRSFEKTWTERRVTGQREVSMKPQGDVPTHEKSPKEKVKSWVGLWVYAVKLGSVEKIHEKFFLKRAEAEKPMPKLPPSGAPV